MSIAISSSLEALRQTLHHVYNKVFPTPLVSTAFSDSSMTELFQECMNNSDFGSRLLTSPEGDQVAALLSIDRYRMINGFFKYCLQTTLQAMKAFDSISSTLDREAKNISRVSTITGIGALCLIAGFTWITVQQKKALDSQVSSSKPNALLHHYEFGLALATVGAICLVFSSVSAHTTGTMLSAIAKQ
jgi:hypothetical protein